MFYVFKTAEGKWGKVFRSGQDVAYDNSISTVTKLTEATVFNSLKEVLKFAGRRALQHGDPVSYWNAWYLVCMDDNGKEIVLP
jgi:hypothetical protein